VIRLPLAAPPTLADCNLFWRIRAIAKRFVSRDHERALMAIAMRRLPSLLLQNCVHPRRKTQFFSKRVESGRFSAMQQSAASTSDSPKAVQRAARLFPPALVVHTHYSFVRSEDSCVRPT
jgi:hypothetical protein